jgi:Mn2+/Fe2+ NRAMP family transporter
MANSFANSLASDGRGCRRRAWPRRRSARWTEFTAVAGVGELYGLARGLTVPIVTAGVLAVVATGSYRWVERTAVLVGVFELAFLAVAWAAHPNIETLAKDAIDLPFDNREFMYLVAAIIGAVFNSWMIFYQQSATVDKKAAAWCPHGCLLGHGCRRSL